MIYVAGGGGVRCVERASGWCSDWVVVVCWQWGSDAEAWGMWMEEKKGWSGKKTSLGMGNRWRVDGVEERQEGDGWRCEYVLTVDRAWNLELWYQEVWSRIGLWTTELNHSSGLVHVFSGIHGRWRMQFFKTRESRQRDRNCTGLFRIFLVHFPDNTFIFLPSLVSDWK